MDYLSELTTKNFCFFFSHFQHCLRSGCQRNALHSVGRSLSLSEPLCLWIWINVCVCVSLLVGSFVNAYHLLHIISFMTYFPSTDQPPDSNEPLTRHCAQDKSRSFTAQHTLLNVRFSNFKFTYNWPSLNILSEWIVGIVVRTGIYSACVYVTHFIITSSPRRASKEEEQFE